MSFSHLPQVARRGIWSSAGGLCTWVDPNAPWQISARHGLARYRKQRWRILHIIYWRISGHLGCLGVAGANRNVDLPGSHRSDLGRSDCIRPLWAAFSGGIVDRRASKAQGYSLLHHRPRHKPPQRRLIHRNAAYFAVTQTQVAAKLASSPQPFFSHRNTRPATATPADTPQRRLLHRNLSRFAALEEIRRNAARHYSVSSRSAATQTCSPQLEEVHRNLGALSWDRRRPRRHVQRNRQNAGNFREGKARFPVTPSLRSLATESIAASRKPSASRRWTLP